jgi:heme-degrading monooxygenase HmoA
MPTPDRNLCGDMRVISLDNRRAQMPEIRENNNGVVTQITTVKVPADNQSEVLELMKERARFMAGQPGFVSVSLHRSEDGSHVVNYVQWKNREELKAAHHQGKHCGRPFIDTKLEERIRQALAAPGRPGVHKLAKQSGVGSGTIQRIARAE